MAEENKEKKDNLSIWHTFSRPPKEALKIILGGRLKGMTDVNPQWRIKAMTDTFGPIGIGWNYTVTEKWQEPQGNEVLCFISIELTYKLNDIWSQPIVGIGGSRLVTKEKDGLYVSDEGYKMALTDALSVAMKQIGVAADIYAGLWDGNKYKDETPKTLDNKTPKDIAEQAYLLWKAEHPDSKKTFKQFQHNIIKIFKRLPTNKTSIPKIIEAVKPDEEDGLMDIDEVALPPSKGYECSSCGERYLATPKSGICEKCEGFLNELQ